MRRNLQRSWHPQSCGLVSKAVYTSTLQSINLVSMFFLILFLSFYFNSIFFRVISLLTFHLGKHIRPIHRGSRAGVLILSEVAPPSTIHPSIHAYFIALCLFKINRLSNFRDAKIGMVIFFFFYV
jgi:hypothetical protein